MSPTEVVSPPSPHRPLPLPRSSSQNKPKGILKNAPAQSNAGAGAHSLQWDEENIALTEIQKDSLMKITEPKTPYVRYNAETDEVEGDIPDLDLNGRFMHASPPGSPTISTANADSSGPSSRRTSVSSTGRPTASVSGRSGSGQSSRSTSFNLPDEARKGIRSERGEPGDEVEVEEEMDEETAAKHAAFVRARGRHYSNEAEAMKRAARMMADDEEMKEVPDRDEIEQDQDEDGSLEEAAGKVNLNGVNH